MNEINIQNFRAVNQEHAEKGLSQKYAFIPTTRVIAVLGGMGWKPSKVQENRVRDGAGAGYQKHLVRFRQEGASSLIEIDKIVPEIVLTNSHNGLAAFSLMAGLFRFICLNGAVVADAMFGTHKVKHIGYADDKVMLAVQHITDTVPQIAEKVKNYAAIELTPDERNVFAMSALAVKYDGLELAPEDYRRGRGPTGIIRDKETGEIVRAFGASELLSPRRREDRAPTLWATYNTIQEKFIKGNRFEIDQVSGYGRKKVRAVNSITEDIRINRGLWMLTESMAKLKTGGAVAGAGLPMVV